MLLIDLPFLMLWVFFWLFFFFSSWRGEGGFGGRDRN